MPIPTYFKNPFIESAELMISRVDIYNAITMNDLIVVPFKDINIRKNNPNQPWTTIKKKRLIAADTRYPGIVYKSDLDPLRAENVLKEYCIFDGTHRVLKMMSEGKTASVFYLMKPEHFDGLKLHKNVFYSVDRTTGCGGCME